MTRWCKGLCGRELPIDRFPVDGRGYFGHRCKACLRVRRRNRYRLYPRIRRRVHQEQRRWYARHVERERAKKRARDEARRRGGTLTECGRLRKPCNLRRG